MRDPELIFRYQICQDPTLIHMCLTYRGFPHMLILLDGKNETLHTEITNDTRDGSSVLRGYGEQYQPKSLLIVCSLPGFPLVRSPHERSNSLVVVSR